MCHSFAIESCVSHSVPSSPRQTCQYYAKEPFQKRKPHLNSKSLDQQKSHVRTLKLHSSPSQDPLLHLYQYENLERENAELKKLVDDAFKLIKRKGLSLEVPACVKKAMLAEPNGTDLETQAASIVKRMGSIRKYLAKATENHRRTLTTSGDISKHALPLLNGIRPTFLESN